jgi:hypothetical protein
LGLTLSPISWRLPNSTVPENYIGGGAIASVTYGKTRNQAKAIVSEAELVQAAALEFCQYEAGKRPAGCNVFIVGRE